MAQIVKKFIGDNQVADEKIRLDNNNALRARNAANSADVNILKVNTSDEIELYSVASITGDASSEIDFNNVRLVNLVDPSGAQDAATKAYVDANAGGSSTEVAAKAAVRLVSLSNLDLSGSETIDGVTTSNGDRVLVAGQTTASQNGIYAVNTGGSWTRATDADASSEFVNGFLVNVTAGTNYADTLWVFDNIGSFTLGSDPANFRKESKIPNKESLTLDGTDITNQYKDLAFTIIPDSLLLVVSGVVQVEGTDYTLSTSGGVTRITFAGDLATGGAAELVATDVLRCQYLY